MFKFFRELSKLIRFRVKIIFFKFISCSILFSSQLTSIKKKANITINIEIYSYNDVNRKKNKQIFYSRKLEIYSILRHLGLWTDKKIIYKLRNIDLKFRWFQLLLLEDESAFNNRKTSLCYVKIYIWFLVS